MANHKQQGQIVTATKGSVNGDGNVFDALRIRNLSEGIRAFFDIVCDVIDSAQVDVDQRAEVREKLGALEASKWSTIRQDYLNTPAGRGDGKDPVQLILDLVHAVDSTNSALTTKIQDVSKVDDLYREQLKTVREEFIAAKNELTEVRWQQKKDKAVLLACQANMEQLENNLKQKADKITELQREGTVQLWEMEKRKILESADKRQKDAEDEISSLKKNMEILNKKYQTSESQLKMLRMKVELQPRGIKNKDEEEDDAEQLKKYVHMLEKDIHAIESEHHNQHKYGYGILEGIQKDFSDVLDEMLHCEERTYQLNENHMKHLQTCMDRLDKCRRAGKQGKLGQLRADLPNYYLATDKDLEYTKKRKLSMAYKPGYKPSGVTQSDNTDNEVASTNGMSSISEEVPSKPPQPNATPTRRSSTHKPIPKSKLQNLYSNKSQEEESDHPVLVNKETGYVDMITVLKNFPHMTKQFIEEQWQQFNRFDKNGDGTLDLIELIAAQTSTIGQQFTATQIKDTMTEVDKDNSGTVDFYEFICVANMLFHKQGRSDVFRSRLVQQEGRHVARTCVLQ